MRLAFAREEALPAINFVQRQLNGERRVIAGVSGCAAIEGGRS